MSESFRKGDLREKYSTEAKLRELQALADNGTWRVVCHEEVPVKANILGADFCWQSKTKEQIMRFGRQDPWNKDTRRASSHL